MRHLIAALWVVFLASLVYAAEIQVNVLPAPIAILPTSTRAIAVQAVELGTNGPIALTSTTTAVDYIAIVSSLTGSLISESQRSRYLRLMTNYMGDEHVTQQDTPAGTNSPTWRMSSPAIELFQLLERIAMKEVQIALINPPPLTNAPPETNSGPPIIIIPNDP